MFDPNDRVWDIIIQAESPRGFRIYLQSGMLIYGPNKYGWHRRTLKRALRCGARALTRKHAEQARLKARQAAVDAATLPR
jgi:hypothetical protein